MTGQIIYNSAWAKEYVSMPDLLSVFGHEPVTIKKHGSEYWYISPFRYEKAPSFHTSFMNGKWIWNDFGRGDIEGRGTVIGFLQLHENVDVSGALKILKELFPHKGNRVSLKNLSYTPLFKSIQFDREKYEAEGKVKSPVSKRLKVTAISDKINDKNLIGYLAGQRKINYKLAFPYLRLITYFDSVKERKYNTLGFQNESGDFECRDKYFKAILKSPDAANGDAIKDISYIPGNQKSRVAVFEGFMDFLSVLTQKNIPVLPVDVIILNMVNLRRRAIDFIKQSGYNEIYTFMDNDKAGQKTTQIFIDELGERAKPQNHLYESYKDYNEYWQNHCEGFNLA
jgi:DNA primase